LLNNLFSRVTSNDQNEQLTHQQARAELTDYVQKDLPDVTEDTAHLASCASEHILEALGAEPAELMESVVKLINEKPVTAFKAIQLGVLFGIHLERRERTHVPGYQTVTATVREE